MSKEKKEMTGYIQFMNVGVGSRSEGFQPFLLDSDISVCRLHHVGDNEFLNQTLVPFHGKYCKVQGTYYSDGKLFRSEKIEELPDPFVASQRSET
jgi:hypothetical protein